MKTLREMLDREILSEQYLLSKNQVYLFGAIDNTLAARIIPQMHYIDRIMAEEHTSPKSRVLTLLINSTGGSVPDGLAIYDTINSLECDVRTICVGRAASMAAIILSAGTKGMRCALPNSEILIHQPIGGTQGQASDIILAAKHIEHSKRMLNSILAMNTGKEISRIEKDTDRDYTMTALEAKEYGIIDSVLTPGRIKAVKGVAYDERF